MNRKQLISYVAEQTELPVSVVKKILHTTLKIILDTLEQGESISLPPLGSFQIKQKEAIFNQEDNTIKPPESMLDFKPSAELKHSLNAPAIQAIMQSIIRG